MLSKRHKLPLRSELTLIQKEGKLFQGKFFSLLVSSQKNTSSKPSRFGFIISTKIHKKATKRNKVRRYLVEIVRGFLPKIKPGFNCVFLVKKAINGKKLTEIKKEIEEMFRKTGLITD